MSFVNPLKIPLYLQTLIGMFLGIFVGCIIGEKAAVLGVFSKYIIEAIKMVAMPLLFFSILEAISMTEIRGRGVFSLFAICFLNGIGAITIALFISNYFQPGQYMPLIAKSGVDLSHIQNSHLFSSLGHSFSQNRTASIFSGTTLAITLAVGIGLILLPLKKILQKRKPLFFINFGAALKWILRIHFKAIEFVALLIPFAVFCSVAKVIALHGFSLVGGLTAYFFACLFGMVLHIVLVYHTWICLISRIPLKQFWKEAREPVVYSFGVNSSLATLPTTLNTLKNLGVSESSARLGACVGTNLNNDGILLYEVVASLFIVQAYGIHLDLFHQLLLTLVCVFATIGVAGVPEAGMISLSLVIATLGLPIEALPLLLTVDWVLGRCRSITNVLGDITVSIGIDALSERNKKPV